VEHREFKSANYVPGVSGYRLDLNTGAFEINRGNFAVGSLPSDPQMITVTAGEWSESDLPRNATKRCAFILDEQFVRIPTEYHDTAELSTEDFSFDRDGSDIRTTLTYRRLETDQETAERVARQAGSGVTFDADGLTIKASGKVMIRLARGKDDKQPAEQPFAVEGDQAFIRQALTDSAMWSVKMQLNSQGQYVAAGMGLGVEPSTDAAISEALVSAAFIDPLSFQITDPADQIRQVIREELRPGGMLHRG
jgi:hypothetical protein